MSLYASGTHKGWAVTAQDCALNRAGTIPGREIFDGPAGEIRDIGPSITRTIGGRARRGGATRVELLLEVAENDNIAGDIRQPEVGRIPR